MRNRIVMLYFVNRVKSTTNSFVSFSLLTFFNKGRRPQHWISEFMIRFFTNNCKLYNPKILHKIQNVLVNHSHNNCFVFFSLLTFFKDLRWPPQDFDASCKNPMIHFHLLYFHFHEVFYSESSLSFIYHFKWNFMT